MVQGTILAAASIIAKIIGLVYRIPLTGILGDEGNSYYSTANDIYTIILLISSFSLPMAISKLMAERIEKGEYRNANRVFICAVRFAVVAGLGLSLITYVFSGVLTKYVLHFELAKYGLRVIAPAILVFAITGTFRGFFQGLGTMVPTAVSQILEQIINAVVSVVCAGLMLRYGLKVARQMQNPSLAPAWAAAGGNFGTVVSVTVAMLFMMIVYARYRKVFAKQVRQDHTGQMEASGAIYTVLMQTLWPIVLSTVLYNISTVLDQGIFSSVLGKQGYAQQQYAVIWGIYVGKFRVLMNVPLSLASCLGPAIVPSLAGDMSKRDRKDASRKISMAIRYTMLLTIPCAFGLAALGGPVITMLFHPETGVPLAAGIMQAGALMIITYALSTLTTSILQGLGHLKEPLINCGIALVIHVIFLFFLLRSANLNIYAVIYSNVIFALVVCVLNALTIRRYLGYRQEYVRTFILPTIAAVIMAFGTYLVYRFFNLFAGNTISVIIAILAGAFIYAVGLVAFHVFTVDEIAAMPKGKSIIRFFRKMGLLR